MVETSHPARPILVVEDDEDIRETLQQVLETEGYSTAGAANGAEALGALLSDRMPCLVLLDLMMPIMSGPELLSRMRQDPRLASIPVIIVSAWAQEAEKTSGAQGFLKKPVDLEALLEVAGQFCASSPTQT